MIAPDTAPGTYVVCVRTERANDFLTLGKVYVVAGMGVGHHIETGRAVVGARVEGVRCTCGDKLILWTLDTFDYAVLPAALTDCLKVSGGQA